jgi:hypothetical protein
MPSEYNFLTRLQDGCGPYVTPLTCIPWTSYLMVVGFLKQLIYLGVHCEDFMS